MIRRILRLFGYAIEYVDGGKVWDWRYDPLDRMMGRPIHDQMSVAPPWAKRRLRRI